MPKENIQRAINKTSGADYEEITYEGCARTAPDAVSHMLLLQDRAWRISVDHGEPHRQQKQDGATAPP